jgi:hypothetical protein
MLSLLETYKFHKNISYENPIVLGEKPQQKYW